MFSLIKRFVELYNSNRSTMTTSKYMLVQIWIIISLKQKDGLCIETYKRETTVLNGKSEQHLSVSRS